MRRAELKELLSQHGLRPQHAFGQNFLVDLALLSAIPDDAGLEAGDRVLEVGPGAGSLTSVLLSRGARILAVEIDHGLSRLLRERFSGELQEGTLELVEGDILEKDERLNSRVEEWWMDGSPPQVIANLPYSISGPFLARLPSRPLKSACLLLQREVAVKACGKWGDKAYGPLTVRLNLAFHARLGRRLPPEVFWPRPQIDSAFLHLSPRSNAPSPELDSAMAVILKFAFGQRRKRLLGRLEKMAPAAAQSLRDAGVSEQARPEQVEPELWRRAAEALE